MERLTKNREHTPRSLGDTGWSDFPPFRGDAVGQSPKNTEMKDLEEIHDCEINMVAENPDVLGYNIDSKLIIWPERREQAVKAKEFLDSGGDVEVLSKRFRQPAERIREAMDEELLKDVLLDETLSNLPAGVKLRITPHAPWSAFSVGNSEKYWESLDDGKKAPIRQTILANLTREEMAVAAELSNEEMEKAIAYKAYANFDYQLESLREIADQIGAEVTIGEVSFYAGEWGESVDEHEQERNAAHGREKGYASLLWPGEQIVKHENPERRKKG